MPNDAPRLTVCMAICRLSVFWTSLTKFSRNQSAIPMVGGPPAFGGAGRSIDGGQQQPREGEREERALFGFLLLVIVGLLVVAGR